MNKDKIDFVIIWVDGNDVKWQKEKSRFDSTNGDDRTIRYRDWDNLRYWFRGIEKYAPWVNRVHFVTWGHIPEWLNINYEKLNIVKHEEFIPKKFLPTFSSHVIELNLHRIDGLEEQFVYFNDDMFCNGKLKKEDFFIDGLPCDSAILSPAIKENKNGIGNIVMNNVGIINSYFEKNKQIKENIFKWYNVKYGKQLLKNFLLLPWKTFTGFYETHVAASFLKSTFEQIWKIEEQTLEEVCSHRFRNLYLDVNQWLFRDWQLANNKFVPRKIDVVKKYDIPLELKEAINDIKKQKHKLICLNDTPDIEDFENCKKLINNAFEMNLNKKSNFEK